jgi:transcriptional regulator with PAS, ATPase and Fis domain
MTFARRLLLVGSDHRFSQTVQTHLHKTFLLTTPVVRAEDLPELVTRDSDGVLLFLASDPADPDRIEAAVRDLRLQQLPPRLAVLECEEFAAARQLDSSAAQLDARFAWPGQLRDLNAWVRRAVTPGPAFVDPNAETVQLRLRRQLLNLTPSLAPLGEQLDIAAAHDVTVLIEGETGTGKTFLARLIHDCSARAAHRFLVVSCGALAGPPVGSELFGHVPGAFAGADAARVGRLAAAGQGTVLLDEVHALAAEHQAALLRVIETGEYEPVGGHETQRSRARLIASTDRDLAGAVERGQFRRDLYYRLHVVTLQLPPLRARPQDVGPLTRGLVARFGVRFGKKIAAVEPDAIRALEQFPWPGNIRQLENVIQQAVLACGEDTLTTAHLPTMIPARLDGRTSENGYLSSLAQNRETTERAVIVRALEKVGQSRTRASQLLGVSRVTLYKKMKKYGLLAKTSNGNHSPVDVSRFSV